MEYSWEKCTTMIFRACEVYSRGFEVEFEEFPLIRRSFLT